MSIVFRFAMAVIIIVTAGCGRDSGQSSTATTLTKQIAVGMSLDEVENLLDKVGIEYSYDPRSRTILAMERNTGGNFLIKESRQIIVEFDADSNVTVVNERTVLTGP